MSGGFGGRLAGRVLFVLAALLCAWRVPLGRADTVTVCEDGSCDHATIQAAIDAESTHAGDTIRILDPVHTELGIRVHKSLSVVGRSGLGSVVQAVHKGQVASDRVFSVDSPATVTLRNIVVRYGRATGRPSRGAGILNRGVLTLEGVTVTHNRALGSEGAPGGTAEGGGIYNEGMLTIVNSTVSSNEAVGGEASSGYDGGDGRGGGIANGRNGVLTVSSSTVSGNSAAGGAGRG